MGGAAKNIKTQVCQFMTIEDYARDHKLDPQILRKGGNSDEVVPVNCRTVTTRFVPPQRSLKNVEKGQNAPSDKANEAPHKHKGHSPKHGNGKHHTQNVQQTHTVPTRPVIRD